MRRSLCLVALLLLCAAPASADVGFDRQSLKIDGRRLVLNSGEVHYWRMPDPAQWPLILDRTKAAGLNAISIYIPWNIHQPGPEISRWDGPYDLERFLALARNRGLYVVARHGPYIQGEMDGGGYPYWALDRGFAARTGDARWTELWRAWHADVLPRVARWQLGGPRRGTVIAVQIENEYPADGPGPEDYMRELYADARARGITVPILHNDQQLFGSQPAPGRFGEIVDLYGFDNYPYGFTCCPAWGERTFSQVDEFEQRYRRRGAEDSPLYLPEIQGGIAPIAGDDGRDPQERYDALRDYATVQTLSLLGQGVTMINQYMFHGGTTWGYLPFPNLGTSYDYAAPIREWGGLGHRFHEQRRLSLQIRATERSLADTVRVPSAPGAYATRRSNVDGALHTFVRDADRHHARYLVANIRLGPWRIERTTAEVALAKSRTLVLFGDRGKEYEAVVNGRMLRFTVGNARHIPMPGGRQVVVVDRAAAGRLWVLRRRVVIGPALVLGDRVETDRDTSVITVTRRGLLRRRVPGPPAAERIELPALDRWRFRAESRERDPDYDDGAWREADVQASAQQVQPLTRPVLFAEAYDLPTGFAWYRGRFSGRAGGVCLEGRHRFHVWLNGRSLGTITSDADVPGPMGLGGLGAFPPVPQASHVRFPADAVRDGENVLAVLTESWGHTMDAAAANQAKQPRGLWSAALDGGCGFAVGSELEVFGQAAPLPTTPGIDGRIRWRVQGGRAADYPNASGLHGEREGWYRERFDDSGWSAVSLPDAGRLGPGEVGWYRTRFSVRLPRRVHAPIGIELDAAPGELFLNGVHVARIGRDRARRFVLMPGLLRVDGRPNTLALARWAVGGGSGAVGRPRLFVYETTRVVRP